MLPSISCICPTYARYTHWAHLLEEAVECFRRQDYAGEMELVVVNDCPTQQLTCDVPNVRVLNFGIRVDTLGEKYNLAIATTRADLIVPWEDDDISLPHRLRSSVEWIGNADYYNPRAYWVSTGGVFTHEQNTGVAHNASMYRRSAWYHVKGYPHDCKQDMGFDTWLRRDCRVVDGPLTAHESWYIYRWGVSDHHVSAYGDPEQAYLTYGDRPVKPGTFKIEPRWCEDYMELVRSHLDKQT